MPIKMTSARLWGLCRKSTPTYGSWRVCSDTAVNLAPQEGFRLGGDGAARAWKGRAGEVQHSEG